MTSFCKFTIGTPGASAAFMLYISRLSAVVEREEGFINRGLPESVVNAQGYGELRSNLEAYAWAREASEEARHRSRGSRGIARSHYRCVLSFERETESPVIRRLVLEWLAVSFPKSMAGCFIHRNTEHVHVHAWIDARGSDGAKLDFSPRAFRQIGRNWDRIYSREMAREDRLTQKLNIEKGTRDEHQSGITRGGGRAHRSTWQDAPALTIRTPGKQALKACVRARNDAVCAARELHQDFARMGRGIKTPHDIERDR